jgi:hypothetical protein
MAGRNIYIGACPYNSLSSNIIMTQGEDVVLVVNMTPPVDITAWTLTFAIVNTTGFTNTYSCNAAIIDGPRGNFTLTIPSTNTVNITVGRYQWDIRREDSGSKTTIADGTIDLRAAIVT